MELNDFRKELLEDVRSSAFADGMGSCAAFVEIIADYLIDMELIPDFQPAFYTGTGTRNRRLRIDGYVLDELDYTMNIAIADFTGDDAERTLTKSDALQTYELAIRFVEAVYSQNLYKKLEMSTPAADFADTLLLNRGNIRKYRLLLLTDKVMSGRIESLPIMDFEGVPVECQIWDIDRIFKVCLTDIGREQIEIDFTDYAVSGIPCLEASVADTDYCHSFLCVIPATILADVYDRYGAQLLEGNVRSFLSTKVAVNKKIRETILTAPNMFFAFNNGISATAVEVVIVNKEDGKYITRVRDFQIINGGQTTASLSNARFKDKANIGMIHVQMKLTKIEADAEDASSIMQKISKSSNSQNKVSDADFFSTHPFHVRIEQLSRRIFAPAAGGAQHDTHWFYERARGQYLQAQMRLSKRDRNQFQIQNPKGQLLTKTDLAKVRNSWRGVPQTVSKGAQTNFIDFAKWIDEQWIASDSVFNERYFQETVALYILFKHTETLVSKQPWYQQGFRANIVTYSLAWLSYLIKAQYPKYTLDLQMIWNRQSVPQAVTDQLLIITKAVHDSITDPARGTANVTQWCKRDQCWINIKDISMRLLPEIEGVLADLDEVKSENKSAVKNQKIISGIEAQTKIVELGPDYWKELSAFIRNNRIGTVSEVDALKIACQMPSKLPNSVQSQQLLALVQKAVGEGWRE